MADGSTDPYVNLYLDHADIRREASEHASDIRREASDHAADIRRDASEQTSTVRREVASTTADVRHDIATEAHRVNSDVKDGQWRTTNELLRASNETNKTIDSDADRITQQNTDFFIAGQQRAYDTAAQLAALKASTVMGLQNLQFNIQSNADRAIAASALESAKLGASVLLGQAQIERTIYQDGNETRKLVNDIERGNLERKLIERTTEVHAHRGDASHWRGQYDHSQFSALSSQLQAVNSQVASTRSDMVNFGNMFGASNAATSNQVR